MKKIYIKPTLSVVRINNESLLGAESGGQGDEWDAKRNDFWADEDESYEAASSSDDWN